MKGQQNIMKTRKYNYEQKQKNNFIVRQNICTAHNLQRVPLIQPDGANRHQLIKTTTNYLFDIKVADGLADKVTKSKRTDSTCYIV